MTETNYHSMLILHSLSFLLTSSHFLTRHNSIALSDLADLHHTDLFCLTDTWIKRGGLKVRDMENGTKHVRQNVQGGSKMAQFLLNPYLCQILTDFQDSFTVRIRRKFVIISSLKMIPPHFKCVTTLPCVLKQHI